MPYRALTHGRVNNPILDNTEIDEYDVKSYSSISSNNSDSKVNNDEILKDKCFSPRKVVNNSDCDSEDSWCQVNTTK